MHRLTQAILRDRLTADKAAATRAAAILTASDPGDPGSPEIWPAWARLLPHVLALEPGMSDDPGLRDLACLAAWYLLMPGDARSARGLAQGLYGQWQQRLGSDDLHTMWAANTLAAALQGLGSYAEARRLDEDSLVREQRQRGKVHPSTLTSAGNLALDLSALDEDQAARALDEETRERQDQGDAGRQADET